MDTTLIALRPNPMAGDAPLRLAPNLSPALEASVRPLIRAAALTAILGAAFGLPALAARGTGLGPERAGSLATASPAARLVPSRPVAAGSAPRSDSRVGTR